MPAGLPLGAKSPLDDSEVAACVSVCGVCVCISVSLSLCLFRSLSVVLSLCLSVVCVSV